MWVEWGILHHCGDPPAAVRHDLQGAFLRIRGRIMVEGGEIRPDFAGMGLALLPP
jgi:hypothetical protein